MLTAYIGRQLPQPTAPTADMRVASMGGLQVNRADGRVVVWSRRPRELFTMLLSAPTGSVGREEIAEALWPDLEPLAAHQNVRSTVASLRRALGGTEWIAVEGPVVRIRLPLGSRDDIAFEERGIRALQDGNFESISDALDQYRGVYLAEDRYNDWSGYRRHNLSNLRRDLVMRAVDLSDSVERQGAVIAMLHGVVNEDPCDEPAIRCLMETYLLVGRRSEVLRLYRQLDRALDEELGVEPEAETVALFNRAREGAGTTLRRGDEE